VKAGQSQDEAGLSTPAVCEAFLRYSLLAKAQFASRRANEGPLVT